MIKKQRNKIYKDALRLVLKTNDRFSVGELLLKHTKLHRARYDLRAEVLPEIGLFDKGEDILSTTDLKDVIPIQVIALLFCIEMTS